MYKESTYQCKVQSVTTTVYLQWFMIIEGKHAQLALVTMQGQRSEHKVQRSGLKV